jgi:trehalose-6-phosphatase
MEVMDVRPETHFVLYIGDDVTDEDAFAALAGDGVGVLVGGAVSASLADYRVDSPEAVRVLLGWIRRRLQRSPHPRP